MNTTPIENEPLACVANAVAPDKQEYWVKEIVPNLYKAVEEIRELPNGWALRFPSTAEILTLAAEDLHIERLCCPFVNYTLEIEPHQGPFWLRMTGGAGVKEFLKMAYESAKYFDPQVAKAAGFDLSSSPKIDSVADALEATNKLNKQYARTVLSK